MRHADRAYRYVTTVASGSALLFLLMIVIVLAVKSYPSIVVNGLKFFTGITWNPSLNGELIRVNGVPTLQGATYGAGVFLFGTLVSSAIAMLLGVPAGIGIALFLTQVAPQRVSRMVSFLVELLAGIPSVVYGFWGLVVLLPLLLQVIEPAMASLFFWVPGLNGQPYGAGLLGSGIILSLMIVPIVASISRDVMLQTPLELIEGGAALGLTKWEITRKIILPYAKTGVIGAVILGLGRALGEVMAVALVSGSALNALPNSLYSPINTIAAFMAESLDSAFTDPSGMYVSALFELGLLLLVITLAVNFIARLLIKQGFVSKAETVIKV